MHDCAPSLRACNTQGMNKSQQEKNLIICVYSIAQSWIPHLQIRFFDIAGITFIIHASSDEAESHVRDDAYAML